MITALIWVMLAAAVEAPFSRDVETCKGPVGLRQNACLRIVNNKQIDPALRSHAWHNLAQISHMKGDDKLAIIQYGNALQIDPDYVHALRERANLFWIKEQYGEALIDYDRAVSLEKLDLSILAERGRLRAQTGDVKGGLKDIDAAVQLSGGDPKVILQRGLTYSYFSHYQDAARDFVSVTHKLPGEAAAWGGLGHAFVKLEIFGAAEQPLSQALSLRKDALWFTDRGITRHELGYNRAAILDYDAALAIKPGEPSTIYDRGLALEGIGDDAAAMKDFNDAASKARFSAVYAARGGLKGRLHDFDGAIKDLTEAMNITPEWQNPYLLRAYYLSQKGDVTMVKRDCAKAKALITDEKTQSAYDNSRICM